MAPTGVRGVTLKLRQFGEDGPTHLELLGVSVAGLCVLLVIVCVGYRLFTRFRARSYWKSTSPNVRAQATAISPMQPTFPVHDKPDVFPEQSSSTVDTPSTNLTEPSPIYDALRAGRPPSYRTSILMWREVTARETAADGSPRTS
jgi:hypothetical protein